MNIQAIGANPATTIVSASEKTLGPRQSQAPQSDHVQLPDLQRTTSSNREVEQAAPISREDLLNAVKTANDFVSRIDNNLKFSVDEETGKTIIKVIDSSTKEIIKQIPSEEMIAMAKALDKFQGLLVHQQA